ncbi:hypothetical protein MUK42_11208 [Musa troglodytarum]|uniref:Uncharacterized protein n=1 Tax=Musa troglodytarum TaxID=320322 RepID=A0A9E7HU87_9LILI|nr:hypothetical protein MUK42_11208 [Musa troglodytarum]
MDGCLTMQSFDSNIYETQRRKDHCLLLVAASKMFNICVSVLMKIVYVMAMSKKTGTHYSLGNKISPASATSKLTVAGICNNLKLNDGNNYIAELLQLFLAVTSDR